MILIGIIALGACAEHTREYSADLQHFEPRDQFTADLDMYTSPSLEIYEETHLFENGLTSQQPVEGTIPRGYTPYQYPNDTSGYRRAGIEWENPEEVTTEYLEKGKDLYNKFCMHCHGESGNGDGPVIQNSKFPPPPSFITGQSSRGGAMMDLREGNMYHTIMYGLNMMGSHASQVNHDERWLIVSYIKSMQAASLPADEEDGATGASDNDEEEEAGASAEEQPEEESTEEESTDEGTE